MNYVTPGQLITKDTLKKVQMFSYNYAMLLKPNECNIGFSVMNYNNSICGVLLFQFSLHCITTADSY